MVITSGLPNRFREALRSANLTGAAVAKRLNVSPALVSLWLKGDRTPGAHQVAVLARLLKVEKSWLDGSSATPAIPDALIERDWFFRPEPQDGGRDYGNANVFATPPDIASLVRETGQNSLDHALVAAGPVMIRYSVLELSTDSPAFADFAEAIDWKDLLDHVRRASTTESKLGTRLAAGLEYLRDSGKILLLRIDDYGTTGLYGNETTTDESSPFAALVRNNLDSSKRTTTAGGSFGVGKAVVWRCSDLSTVAFASRIAAGFSPHSEQYRFIAKAELTWHQHEAKYAGPGWLGQVGTNGKALWVDEGFLERVQMGRHQLPDGVDANRSSGTTILVIGFRDPEAQGPTNVREVAETIAREASRNFWPAIQRRRLSVIVEAYSDGKLEKSIVVPTSEHVRECFDALRKHEAAEVTDVLNEPGDVVRVVIPVTIPATKAAAKGIQQFDERVSNAILLVRLAGPDELQNSELNRIALVRGRGMVVKYWRRENIIVGAHPFHAALFTGEAVGSDAGQVSAEQFFRVAEPPAHDDWRWNDELREKYERGAKTKLDVFFEQVTAALKKVITPPAKAEEEGPPELKRLLQLDAPPPPGAPPATIRSHVAALENERWVVEADIHVTDRNKLWAIAPRLSLRTEDNSSLRIEWESLEAVPEGSVEHDGAAFLPDAATKRFRFKGTSRPDVDGIRVSRCRAQLEISVQAREE
jgi:transcriptional regulator with XRE-family HTH domain